MLVKSIEMEMGKSRIWTIDGDSTMGGASMMTWELDSGSSGWGHVPKVSDRHCGCSKEAGRLEEDKER